MEAWKPRGGYYNDPSEKSLCLESKFSEWVDLRCILEMESSVLNDRPLWGNEVEGGMQTNPQDCVHRGAINGNGRVERGVTLGGPKSRMS